LISAGNVAGGNRCPRVDCLLRFLIIVSFVRVIPDNPNAIAPGGRLMWLD